LKRHEIARLCASTLHGVASFAFLLIFDLNNRSSACAASQLITLRHYNRVLRRAINGYQHGALFAQSFDYLSLLANSLASSPVYAARKKRERRFSGGRGPIDLVVD